MAEAINDSVFAEKVENSSGLVMVDFWAPWCGPCQMLGPSVEKLAEEMTGKVSVYKLNVDENRQTAAKFRIMSIPTIMWFKDGKVVDSVLGAVPYEALVEKANELLG
ncbi:MAG: thioredoxin [bacterium]